MRMIKNLLFRQQTPALANQFFRGILKTPLQLVAFLCLFASSATNAGIIADYSFDGDLSSNVGSAADLTAFGSTGVFGADGGESVYDFTSAQGLDYDNSGGEISSTWSIAMRVKFDALTGYTRLIRISDTGWSDLGMYLLNGNLHYYNYGSGPDAVAVNTFADIVLTRDSAGNLSGYLDGVLQWVKFDSHGNGVASSTLRFFKDESSEDDPGSVSRLQIYDTELSGAQVSALDMTTVAVPSPASILLLAAGLLGVHITRKKQIATQ